jgi:hypothetical protein
MVVELTVDTVSADPPNDTVAPVWKPVPAMVTDVPPAAGPLLGVTDVTAGAATYVKQLEHVPVCVSGFVTTTFTAPAECAVVVPVMLVAPTVAIESADPPNETVAPETKPVPVTVTDVPPTLGPLVGVTAVTVGPATYVKQSEQLPFCPSGLATVTFTTPAAWAVVVPVMLVGLIADTVSGDPAKDTLDPLTKLVPATVTVVPPALGPLFGVTDVTAGAATYVKQPLHVPLCPSALVTTTLTAPAACAVVVPVIEVGSIVETVSEEPPKETVAPDWKPLPLIVTDVPPAASPLFGATDVTTGAATYEKQPLHVAFCASGFATVRLTVPAA